MRGSGHALWVLAFAALAGLAGVSIASHRLNQDVGWFIHMARVLLDGGTIYRDVIDTNPPLIVWCSFLPALAGRVLRLSDAAAVTLLVVTVASASLMASAWVMARTWTLLSAHARGAIAAVMMFLLLMMIRFDFGQREHLAVLLSMPYFFSSMSAAAGHALSRRTRSVMAVLAGIGLSLKPPLLLAAVSIELYFLIGDRRLRRVETFAVAGVVAAYATAIVLFAPRFLPASVIIARLHPGLNPPVSVVLRVDELRLYAVAGVMMLLLGTWRDHQRFWMVLFLAATGLLAGALVQMKGWPYHLYPARVALLLLIVGTLLSMVERIPGRPWLARIAAWAIVIGVVVFAVRGGIAARRPDPHDVLPPLRAVVERHANGGPIFVMGMLLYPAFPLVNHTGVSWASRYNSLWFLPGLYAEELAAPSGPFRFHTPEQMDPLERTLYDEVIGDLCRARPTVLIVESVTHLGPAGRRPFDLLFYYGQAPRFRRLFSAYAPVGRAGAFTAYVPQAPVSCD